MLPRVRKIPMREKKKEKQTTGNQQLDLLSSTLELFGNVVNGANASLNATRSSLVQTEAFFRNTFSSLEQLTHKFEDDRKQLEMERCVLHCEARRN